MGFVLVVVPNYASSGLPVPARSRCHVLFHYPRIAPMFPLCYYIAPIPASGGMDKTELLLHPDSSSTISFANGSPVPTTHKAKYLGSQITRTTPPKAAIKFRKDEAEAVFSKLITSRMVQ